jgi:hypothetical protein
MDCNTKKKKNEKAMKIKKIDKQEGIKQKEKKKKKQQQKKRLSSKGEDLHLVVPVGSNEGSGSHVECSNRA